MSNSITRTQLMSNLFIDKDGIFESLKTHHFELPEDAKLTYGGIKGEKLHESTKELLRQINLGKKHTEQTKNKISKTMKGIVPWNVGIPNSPEHKNKISNKLSREWLITYPDGMQIKIKNMDKFCKENGLFKSNMYKVAYGKQKHHRGFTCLPVQDISV